MVKMWGLVPPFSAGVPSGFVRGVIKYHAVISDDSVVSQMWALFCGATHAQAWRLSCHDSSWSKNNNPSDH